MRGLCRKTAADAEAGGLLSRRHRKILRGPLVVGLRIVATAYYRMSFAWLGTPVLLLVGLAAPLRDKGALVWSMVLCMTLGSLAVADVGIDTVGPVHFAELSLPLLLLTVGGLHRMQRALAPVPDSATWLGTAILVGIYLLTSSSLH